LNLFESDAIAFVRDVCLGMQRFSRCDCVVLDVSQSQVFGAAFVGMLVGTRRLLGERGCALRLVDASPFCQGVLSAVGFDVGAGTPRPSVVPDVCVTRGVARLSHAPEEALVDGAAQASDADRASAFEYQVHEHLSRVLRRVLRWQCSEEDLSSKLAVVREAAQLFERQSDSLWTQELVGGFMCRQSEAAPRLAVQIAALHGERDRLELALHRLVARFDRAFVEDRREVQALFDCLHALLRTLRRHEREAMAVTLESCLQDDGGEG
jgi:hypothetical protein